MKKSMQNRALMCPKFAGNSYAVFIESDKVLSAKM